MKHMALVGMKHRERESGVGIVALVASLPTGEDLELVREPDNKYDRFAVQVWARGHHVGYIAAAQNRELATMLDARAAKFPLGGERARTPAKLYVSSKGAPLVEVIQL
jgi:HIRAN domain-containing protein